MYNRVIACFTESTESYRVTSAEMSVKPMRTLTYGMPFRHAARSSVMTRIGLTNLHFKVNKYNFMFEGNTYYLCNVLKLSVILHKK